MDVLTLTQTEATAVGVGFLALGAMTVAVSAIVLILYILFVVGLWKIFVKAGEKGWKAIIPIYNVYVMFRMFWNTKMFWILLGVSFGAGILAGLFGGDPNNMNLFGSLIILAASIFELVVDIMLDNRMSKSFGHGVGFTLGLIFLPFVFTIVLGFGGDKYKKIKG